MPPVVSPPPAKPRSVRACIWLPTSQAALMKRLASETDEGNVSRLVRRLVREEADRRQLAKGETA